MISNVVPPKKPNSVVLRRRSSNCPRNGKRIHGIVFDHPSMPKIMAVSSIPSPQVTQDGSNSSRLTDPKQHTKKSTPPALIHSPSGQASTAASEQAHSTVHTPFQDASPYYTKCSGEPSRTNLPSQRQTTADHSRPPSAVTCADSSPCHGTGLSSAEQPKKSTAQFPPKLGTCGTNDVSPREHCPEGNSPGCSSERLHAGTSGSPGVGYPDRFHMQHHQAMVPPGNESERAMSYPSDQRDRGYVERQDAMGPRGTKAVKRTMSYPSDQRDRGYFERQDAMGSRGNKAAKRIMSYPSDQRDRGYFEQQDAMGSRGTTVKRTMSYPSDQRGRVYIEQHGQFIISPTNTAKSPNIDLNNLGGYKFSFHPQQAVRSARNATSPPGISANSVHDNRTQFYPPESTAPQENVSETRPRLSSMSDEVNWRFHTDQHQVSEPSATKHVYRPRIATLPTSRAQFCATARGQHALQRGTTRFQLAQHVNTRRNSTGGLGLVDNHVGLYNTKSQRTLKGGSASEASRQYYHDSAQAPEISSHDVGTPPPFVKPPLARSVSVGEGRRVPESTRHRASSETSGSGLYHKKRWLHSGEKSPSHGGVSGYLGDLLSSPKFPNGSKNRTKTKREDVFIISDSDEDGIDCHSVGSSSCSEWENCVSDVFSVSDGGHTKRERSAVACELEKADQDTSAGRRVSPAVDEKSTKLIRNYPNETDRCAEDLLREGNRGEAKDVIDTCKGSGRHAREEGLGTNICSASPGKNEGKLRNNDAVCGTVKNEFPDTHVANPTELAKECSVCTAIFPPRSLAKHENFASDINANMLTSSRVMFSTEENNNLSVDEHRIVRIRNTTAVCSERTNIPCQSQAEIYRRNSKVSTTRYECDPRRSDDFFESSGHGSVDKETVKQPLLTKEPPEISKSDLRTGSSSPTFELGFLTHQLSKLTDDQTKCDVKKDEHVVAAYAPETGSSTHEGSRSTHVRKTDDGKWPCECCKDTTNAIKIIRKKLLERAARVARKQKNDKLHCPSCDCLRTVGKRSEATVTKTAKKPTGIVVGIKKDRNASEPLTSKTAEADDLVKDFEGGNTSCSRIVGVFGGFEGKNSDLGKGLGLLQFNVIEKSAGMAWGDKCAEYKSESLVKGITSQQWEAYSVKLEKGETRKQCDHATLDGGARVRQEPGTEKLSPGDENTHDRAAFQKWRDEPDRGVGTTPDNPDDLTSDSEDQEYVEDLVSPSELNFSNVQLSAGKDIGEVFEESSEAQEVSDDVTRKRANSHLSEKCAELEKDDGGGKKYFSEICKRQKLGEHDTDENDSKSTSCSDVEVNTDNEGDGENGVGAGKQLTQQLEALQIERRPPSIPKKPEVQNVTCEKTSSVTSTYKAVVYKRIVKSAEVQNFERRKALTSNEWMAILVGRINQVRESIEVEQTPWKTKNKRKVLEKLQHQLKDWEGCSPNEGAAFLARKLQFFQTVRHQYELMKTIDAQRNMAKKIAKKIAKNVQTEERPKSNVSKENNINTKENSKISKQENTSPPSREKEERLSIKKI